MLQKKYSAPTECRSRAGPFNARTLVCTVAIMAAGLGLTACVGPYDDGYGHSRTHYQAVPDDYHDDEYGPRRSNYRQFPFASPDRQRWDYGWWRGAGYWGDRWMDER